MPQENKQVQFYFGTQAEYNNLTEKDNNAIYLITDQKKIYIGDDVYVSPLNIRDIDGLSLDEKFLSAFNTQDTNSEIVGTIPVISQTGQLTSSGHFLQSDVPENVHFLTESQYTAISQTATTEHNGLMSSEDKTTLNNLQTTIDTAVTAAIEDIPVASSSNNGLMSASDKTKLNEIDTSNYIPKVSNQTGEIPKFKSDGTLESTGFTLGKSVPSNAVFTDTTYNVATSSSNGLMPAEDKTKLDSINTAGYDSVNQEYHGGLLSTQDYEDFKDLLENGAGSSTVDFTNAPRVTTSSDGFMLAADKAKLDNITGISNNTKFEFCTASEYNQMVNRTAAIYFVLNNSTLSIKDANNNLLTLGNVGNNISLNPTVSFTPLSIYPSTEITVNPNEGTSLESHFEQQEGGE